MNKTGPLWGSISVLVGAVIAVLALARGVWQIPFLLVVFGVWGLWLIITQLLPAWRSVRAYRRKERQAQKQRSEDAALMSGFSEDDLSLTLLHHVNHRISSFLKAAYPNVRWEWMVKSPAHFAAQGGVGRIRVYGVPEFDYADVELDQRANLRCSLVKVVPVLDGQAEPDAPAPNQQPVDPQVWYEMKGRKVLEGLVTDLSSRGHNSLTLKEDGSICIQPMDGGEEIEQDVFQSFPDKVYWPRLAKVLEQEGLAAAVQGDCITVSW